jgi:hypothetical protein
MHNSLGSDSFGKPHREVNADIGIDIADADDADGVNIDIDDEEEDEEEEEEEGSTTNSGRTAIHTN